MHGDVDALRARHAELVDHPHEEAVDHALAQGERLRGGAGGVGELGDVVRERVADAERAVGAVQRLHELIGIQCVGDQAGADPVVVVAAESGVGAEDADLAEAAAAGNHAAGEQLVGADHVAGVGRVAQDQPDLVGAAGDELLAPDQARGVEHGVVVGQPHVREAVGFAPHEQRRQVVGDLVEAVGELDAILLAHERGLDQVEDRCPPRTGGSSSAR